ncbi:hypothetical protein RMR10_013225 [Agrobacterium rosae]|uniref:hypothetical protein n=1 Tax=Agrobacterium rosae TaxID=1972867 RepID=UPI002A132EE5|nr:hypothetical protein [Agrobacterium rosae]MDX8316540.1 hypothetical protein [Agrobacterium rosae]
MGDSTLKPIRSPNYPSMPLREAVQAVRKIESIYKLNPVDRESAARLIGYSSLSGPAGKALAALAAYGLFERAGKGEGRVTSRAIAILHAYDEKERRGNLLDAASEPTLFAELRDRFAGIPVPPESGVITYLNRQGFNPSAVRPAANAFLETMRYVEELQASTSSATQQPDTPDSVALSDGQAEKFGGAKIGDLIQWESQGVLQFTRPLRVRYITDDGKWVGVEGSQTGIPMSEVIVESVAVKNIQPPTFPVDEIKTPPSPLGETDWMRFRVGPETNVRLLVTGHLGPREISRLIKLLEAQKMVLEDDD